MGSKRLSGWNLDPSWKGFGRVVGGFGMILDVFFSIQLGTLGYDCIDFVNIRFYGFWKDLASNDSIPWPFRSKPFQGSVLPKFRNCMLPKNQHAGFPHAFPEFQSSGLLASYASSFSLHPKCKTQGTEFLRLCLSNGNYANGPSMPAILIASELPDFQPPSGLGGMREA